MKRRSTMLVTGAARGIGRRLAEHLLETGCNVVACDTDLESMSAVPDFETSRCMTVLLDVRDDAGWARAVDDAVARFGALDGLFNVAGVLRPGNVDGQSAGDVDFHIDVNLKGMIHGCRHAARVMVPRGEGLIVNVASLAGLAPVPGLSLYSASKFGVRGYSLAIRRELRTSGVDVSVVCPDAVETPMLDLQVDYDEAAMTFSGSRALTTDEVVYAIMHGAVRKRRAEIRLPESRAMLAKLSSMVPSSIDVMHPLVTWMGRRAQRRRRER